MDPATLVMSALTAGAVAALQETAGTAVKDAYQGLTALMKKKFMKDPKAIVALEGHAEDPQTWQKPLEKSIRDTGAAEDKEILAAARSLLEIVQSQKLLPKYDVAIKGNVQGLVQGDNAQVTMNFEDPAPKRKTRRT